MNDIEKGMLLISYLDSVEQYGVEQKEGHWREDSAKKTATPILHVGDGSEESKVLSKSYMCSFIFLFM